MGLDFDVYAFCRNLRQTKPPYECPVSSCRKIYRSVIGLQYHLFNYDHNNPQPTLPGLSKNSSTGKKKGRSSAHPSSSHSSPEKFGSLEGLTYAEAQKMVEFDIGGGRSQRISIFEPLEVVSLEDYQASVPSGNVDDVLRPVEPGRGRGVQPEGESPVRGMPVAAAVTKLPEPSFRLIEDYNIPDAMPLPNSYIRFIEKSPDELDAEVEYDADEEDGAWLELANEKRGMDNLPPVSEENFELLMDRLEKECYFQMASTGQESGALIDDDAVCCICIDGECQNSNVILFCDMCNLAVHQDCYGVPYIPEGQWLCRRCLQSPSRAVDCVLCPNNGGAFKQTDRGTWAHVVCALWIPEVRFANTVFLEPIDSIETIPAARWKLTCYICKQKGVGACIQCHKTNCYAAFHVTCAQQAGLHMKMDTVRDSGATTGELSVLVQKTAFCDTHTPADAEPRPRMREKEKDKECSKQEESKEKMKKARKLLAKKRSSVPIISIPTIPPERIQEIASLVQIPRRNQFIQRLLAYWTLKRQHRHGVPLLRRLQTSAHPSRRPAEAPISLESEPESSDALLDQLKYWQSLRQDLERARLLCELVRKREKLKKELVKIKESVVMLELQPLAAFLSRVIEQIQSKDTGDIFSQPVNQEEVPDYGLVVTQPMDLSTMRQKLEDFKYISLESLEADFQLMISNCMAYNSKDTVFYRAAVRMRDQGGAILRQARRDLTAIGFNPDTGLLLPNKPQRGGDKASCSDEQLIVELDAALLNEERKDLPLSEQLIFLLDLLDRSMKLKHGVARAKRTRQIKTEITTVRRKIAMEQSGTAQGKRRRKSTDSAGKRASGREAGTEDEEEESMVTTEDAGSSSSSSSSAQASCSDSDTDDTSLGPRPYQTRLAAAPPAEPTRLQRTRRHKSTEQPMTLKQRDSVAESTSTEAVPGKRTQRRKSSSSKNDEEKEQPSVACRPSMEQRAGDATPSKDVPAPTHAATAPEASTQSTPQKKVVSSPLPASSSPHTGSPSGVNRRTAVLFTRKAAAAAFRKPEVPPSSMKRRVGRPRKNLDAALGLSGPDLLGLGNSVSDSRSGAPSVPASESFRVYRSGGEIAAETDEESEEDSDGSSSNSSSNSSSSGEELEQGEESDSNSSSAGHAGPDQPAVQPHSDSSADEGGSQGDGNFDSLDLVWAKCRGYPWYPALIIDPKMPRTGFVKNGVPIPAPPSDVLALATNYRDPVYLVLFFDTKRTWQWLPRNKIEPLMGVTERDQAKLCESRKPAERKAVRKAYQEAMLYRHQVSGPLERDLLEAATAASQSSEEEDE